jgi:murein DD-endopeptidase MepM/ murein hydrolase activator NlpD
MALSAASMLLALPLPLAASSGPGQRSWERAVFPVASFAGFTSVFGLRHHPLSGALRPHDGLDIAAPLGSPVRSWWGGRVLEVIADRSCGNGLVIRSGDYEHIYCHLAGRSVEGFYRSGPVLLAVGDRVAAGQTIGHVGISGATTGPHLHWGLRHRGSWLDPVLVLRAMAASRNMARSVPQRRFNVGLMR